MIKQPEMILRLLLFNRCIETITGKWANGGIGSGGGEYEVDLVVGTEGISGVTSAGGGGVGGGGGGVGGGVVTFEGGSSAGHGAGETRAVDAPLRGAIAAGAVMVESHELIGGRNSGRERS